MHQIELKEGTTVVTAEGKDVGRINRFILDPHTNEVTHIVVQKGWLFSEDKVVPFDRVRSASEDKVVLNDDIGDVDRLPPFEEAHYVQVGDADVNANRSTSESHRLYIGMPTYYWYPPLGYAGFPAYGLPYASWPQIERQQNIPADTIPIKEGTNVISSDGKHVGDVDRLFLESSSNRVTHFLISQGMLFKDHKQVPASWIRTVTETEVRLSVPSNILERLPSYEL
jgi:uncharacterized protein YrrD